MVVASLNIHGSIACRGERIINSTAGCEIANEQIRLSTNYCGSSDKDFTTVLKYWFSIGDQVITCVEFCVPRRSSEGGVNGTIRVDSHNIRVKRSRCLHITRNQKLSWSHFRNAPCIFVSAQREINYHKSVSRKGAVRCSIRFELCDQDICIPAVVGITHFNNLVIRQSKQVPIKFPCVS